MDATAPRKHGFPPARPEQQPTPWWYFARAVYVSRRDYLKIFLVFIAIGIPLGLGGLFTGVMPLFWVAVGLAVLLAAAIVYEATGGF